MKHRIPTTALALAAGAALVTAFQSEGAFEVPFSFTAGTPARAAEVNANFAAVASELGRLGDGDAQAASALGTADDELERLEFGERRVLVSLTGGEFTSVSAALDSIDAATAEKPWLVQVAPGVYEEDELCLVKSFVHLRGSGRGTTVLRGARSSSLSNSDATLVELQDRARVSALTVHNTSVGPDFTIGLRAAASIAGAVVEDVAVRVDGEGNFNSVFYGVEIERGSLTLERCEVHVIGGDWLITAVSGFALVDDDAELVLSGCSLNAEGEGGLGVDGHRTRIELSDCDVEAGFSAVRCGVSSGVGHARITRCRLRSTDRWAMATDDVPGTFRVAASRLVGADPVDDPQAFQYFGCYDAAFQPIADGQGSDVGF